MKKILLLLLLISFSNYSQKKDLIINPYAGINFPTGDLKNFSENGFVIGTSVDYYVWEKLGFGLDFNYQNNSYSFPYSIPNVSSPFGLSQTENGKWNTSTFTLGPTYRIGNKKFTAEIYSKAGISYTKSPENIIVLSNNGFSKPIFNLPSQKRTSFGLTSGIRFNYKLSDRFNLFLNPQYVFSTAKVDYCNCGIENSSNPDDLINAQPIKETIKPSYFNLNAGLNFSFGGSNLNQTEDNTSISRNIPFCDIAFEELECNTTTKVLKLTMFWSGYNPSFTRIVEIYDGSTLINPATVTPQILSQNTGTVPFYTPIQSNLIGANLTAIIKVFDLNNNQVCTKQINFTVPNCSPQSPYCEFNLDLQNATTDGNTISYNATNNWSNLNVGSIISFVVVDQNGNTISPVTISPSLFPLTITSANSTSSINYSISIPYSYNGTSINFMLQIDDSVTGALSYCSFADYFTPNVENVGCGNFEITEAISCNIKSGNQEIFITTNYYNIPQGSILNYTLLDANNQTIGYGGSSFPINISGTGSYNDMISVLPNVTGPVTIKMEINDVNGVVICEKVLNITLNGCSYKSCTPINPNTECINGTPQITFEVPWANFPLFNGYSIYADVYDTNTPNANLITSIPAYPLTGVNGSQTFTVSIPSQYEGTTVYINTRICEHGGIKDCCPGKLEVDVPECCEDCSRIKIQNNTNHNQKGEAILKNFGLNFNIVNTGTSIKQILITLESFGANNSTNSLVEPIPNFEISGVGVMVGSGLAGNPIGSFSSTGNRRSNLWQLDFSANPFSGTSQLLVYVEKYDRKIIKNYQLKFTIFRTDGSICEITRKINN